MSTANFLIKPHVFEGQHIRHYPGATRHREEDVQYLEAKQYIPLDNPNPQPDDITILFTHATGFTKELYEPFWDDLLESSKQRGFRVRSIWAVDSSHQGASGILNERTQGDDPSAADCARDLLLMVNLFRKELPQPIVGIGHSLGATALVQLSIMHPRLFTSLVLMDPVIGTSDLASFQHGLLHMNASRADLWPSREVAEATFRKGFRKWDSRVVDRWMECGLRETPTLLFLEPGQITLRTTKAQEGFSYGRPAWDIREVTTTPQTDSIRIKYPDHDQDMFHFYRAEVHETWAALLRLRPDVLYMYPEKGLMTNQDVIDRRFAQTGSGAGGSGGAKEGRVAMAIVKNAGHLLTFERPSGSANAAAEWLGKDLKAWKIRTEYERTHRDDKSVDKLALSREWVRQTNKKFSKPVKPAKTVAKL